MVTPYIVGNNPNDSSGGDGTRDYTDVGDWETDTGIDLVTPDICERLQWYDDAASYADTVTFTGATTGPNNYRIFSAHPTQRHDGTSNNGVTFDTSSGDAAFKIREDNFSIQGLVITHDSSTTGSRAAVEIDNPNCSCIGMIFFDCTNSSTGSTGGVDLSDAGCVVVTIAENNDDYGIQIAGGTGNTAVAYNCQSIGNGGMGFSEGSGLDNIVKNCTSTENTGADFDPVGWHGDSTHNSSDDLTAPLGNEHRSISLTNLYENPAGNDFRIQVIATTDVRNAGIDLSSDTHFPFSMDNQEVAYDVWDRAAIEPEPASGATTLLPPAITVPVSIALPTLQARVTPASQAVPITPALPALRAITSAPAVAVPVLPALPLLQAVIQPAAQAIPLSVVIGTLSGIAPEFRVVQQAARTTTGTQDFTVSGFGGVSGAITGITRGLINGSTVDHAVFGIGFTDTSAEFAGVFMTEHGATPVSDSARMGKNDELLLWHDLDTGVDGEANFDSVITDGIRVNYATNAPAAAYLVTTLLMRSKNISSGEGLLDQLQDVAKAFTTGHPIDVLLVFGTAGNFAGSSFDSAEFTFGVCVNDGSLTQWGVANVHLSSTTTPDAAITVRDDMAHIGLTTGEPPGNFVGGEVTALNPTSFEITKRLTGSTDTFGWIAIELDDGYTAYAGLRDAPVATGPESVRDLGLRPLALLGMATLATSVNTIETSTANGAGSFGLFLGDNVNQYCHAIAFEADTAPTNTESLTSSALIVIHDGAGGTGLDVSYDSQEDGGWDWTWNATKSGAKVGVLSIGETVTVLSAPVLSIPLAIATPTLQAQVAAPAVTTPLLPALPVLQAVIQPTAQALPLLVVTGTLVGAPTVLRVTQQAARTTIGTQDFTVAGVGTPNAALVLATRGLINGTVAAHAALGLGVTDGTNHRAISVVSEDGRGVDSNTNRIGVTDEVILLEDPVSGTDGAMQFDSWITDGLRLDADANPFDAAYLINTLLIRAQNATVGETQLTAAQDAAQTISVGHPVDMVIVFGTNGNFSGTPQTQWGFSLGVGVNDGSLSQWAIGNLHHDAQASPAAPQILSNNRVQVHVTLPVSVYAAAELTGFPTDAFELTKRDSAEIFRIGWLALELDASVSPIAIIRDAPAGTGQETVGDAGIVPDALFGVGTLLTTENVIQETTANGAGAHSVFMGDNTNQYCQAVAYEPTTVPTNTESLADNQLILMNDGAGVAGLDVVYDGTTATGWQWTFNTTKSGAKIALFGVGEPVTQTILQAPAVSIPLTLQAPTLQEAVAAPAVSVPLAPVVGTMQALLASPASTLPVQIALPTLQATATAPAVPILLAVITGSISVSGILFPPAIPIPFLPVTGQLTARLQAESVAVPFVPIVGQTQQPLIAPVVGVAMTIPAGVLEARLASPAVSVPFVVVTGSLGTSGLLIPPALPVALVPTVPTLRIVMPAPPVTTSLVITTGSVQEQLAAPSVSLVLVSELPGLVQRIQPPALEIPLVVVTPLIPAEILVQLGLTPGTDRQFIVSGSARAFIIPGTDFMR